MTPKVKICIINRNYPPEPGATGFYAKRLADVIQIEHHFEIQVVSIGMYQNEANIKRIKSWYSGKLKLVRMISSFIESYYLIKRGLQIKADLYLIMTDPPFLNYWACKLLDNKRWILWTMDLYPEAFVANQLVGKLNSLVQSYQKVLRKNPPNAFISLGKHQRNYVRETYFSDALSCIIPVGLQFPKAHKSVESNSIPEWHDEDKITLGYIGSIGEAHDKKAIVQLIRNLDTEKFKFVLSCYGSKSKRLIKSLEGFENVVLLEHVPIQYFKFIDIQIVSLKNDWTHICVPSKALTAVEQYCCILFLGSNQSDTWNYIQKAGWIFDTPDAAMLFLENLSHSDVAEKKIMAQAVTEELYELWDSAIINIKNLFLNLNKSIK